MSFHVQVCVGKYLEVAQLAYLTGNGSHSKGPPDCVPKQF